MIIIVKIKLTTSILVRGKNTLIFSDLYVKSPVRFPNQENIFGKKRRNNPIKINKLPLIINTFAISYSPKIIFTTIIISETFNKSS